MQNHSACYYGESSFNKLSQFPLDDGNNYCVENGVFVYINLFVFLFFYNNNILKKY